MSPTFSQLGVPESICHALDARGITSPFAIQAATVADAMAGRDVCGRAPTGSGKTIAFGIPVIARVEKSKPKRPRALILAPTRELADQIAVEMRTFAGDKRIGVVYGGVGYGPQLKALQRGVDVLVACPGRLEDLIEQGAVSLADADIVVLDEADRMADMGFMPAVKRLLDQTSANRQTVLFSATLDGDVIELTERYQNDPVRHEVGDETPDITAADHLFWKVAKVDRTDVAAEAVTAVWPAIIFCRTRHGSDRLAKQLGRRGVKAAAIHGGRSQAQRTRALNDFSKNKVEALVATDVAARGIHVDGVAAVIQFDPPEDHKTYIHRAGRTARAGEGGIVISLITPEQVKESRKMQRRAELDTEITAPEPELLIDLAPPPPAKPRPTMTEDRETTGQSQARPGKKRNGNRGPQKGKAKHQSKGRDRDGTTDSRQPKADGRQDRTRDRDASDDRTPNAQSDRKPRGQQGGAKRKNSRTDERDGSSRSGTKPARSGAQKGRHRAKAGAAAKGKPGAKANRSRSKQQANHNSGPGGAPNRKARRAHLQKQR